MSPNTATRRQFVKRAGLYVASSTLVLPAGFACSADDNDDSDGYLPYPPWQAKANAFEAGGKCCWTSSAPAPAGQGGPENHLPMVSVDDNGELKVWMQDGHPMNEEHWITTVYVRDQRGIVLELADFGEQELYSQYESTEFEWTESTPAINIEIPPGTTQLKAYAYCNLHRHWAGDIVNV